MGFDTDVLILGSGFGGAVAACRFAEAGHRVTVMERGAWVSRETHEVDLDALWQPDRHRFGFNELRPRGKNLVPWVGACVGGGSYVYAGTLKRTTHFEDYPEAIQQDDMEAWYERAEEVMDPAPFPDYPPYGELRATQLLIDVGKELQKDEPELVEEYGPIQLGIAFAPPRAEDGMPGEVFTNKHGARQRYSDPREQSLLGGDIEAKNTLDRNYLFLAEVEGAEILDLCEAERIEPLPKGGYRVHYERYVLEETWGRQVACKWLPWVKPRRETRSITCARLVLAAGAVGSTELLLRARDRDESLPALSSALGERYTTNGDFVSLLVPFRGLGLSWAGLIAAIVCAVLGQWIGVAIGAVAYFAGLAISRRNFDPDLGTTNSDYIRFRGRDGGRQGGYIESGRYPTPVRLGFAVLLSSLGLWRPRRYHGIVRFTNLLRRFVPPFALIARTWPIPLLKMGRDDAFGRFVLEDDGHVRIDYDIDANREFYAWLDGLARKIAKKAKAHWAPNFLFRLTGKLEIPHNQGGVPMGETPAEGVVDHCGRVFGYDDLMVLDGSILPASTGPNPALTILAVAERAMSHLVEQAKAGPIRAVVSGSGSGSGSRSRSRSASGSRSGSASGSRSGSASGSASEE